ncbi:MAG: hypothetical protein ACXWTY_01855 [Methylobacter sp.]
MSIIFGDRAPYLEFNDEHAYYKSLGFLVRGIESGICKIVHENNQDQGAWGEEYRIQIFGRKEVFDELFREQTKSRVSAGVGRCLGRINCNQYIEKIKDKNKVNLNGPVDTDLVITTVPEQYQSDFDDGYSL